MLINNRLGEYLINKDIQNLDQAITLARNHDEWLTQFEKYSRLNKSNTIQNVQKQSLSKMQPAALGIASGTQTRPLTQGYIPNYTSSISNCTPYVQNAVPLLEPNYNQRFIPSIPNRNYNRGMTSAAFNSNRNVASNSNVRIQNNSQPMDVDPSNSRARLQQHTNLRRPLMGFANGRRIFQHETNDLNEIENGNNEYEYDSNEALPDSENFLIEASMNNET